MTKQNSFARRTAALVGSPKFFWGILALFVLQAVWIACTGRYPMAFDEDFHLGIIRLYSYHIAPFWSAQPVGASNYGAVFRDPSYLYQYLMSFPYRLIKVFTSDQTVIVMWLRAINIALFAAGLAIYRRLLIKTGASRTIVHGVLLVFVLIPVVPLLAAQINYDNLFLPVVGLTLLLVVNFGQQLSQRKVINGGLLIQIFILCLLGSLVKYAFLPIFVAIVIYLAVVIWQSKTTKLARLGRRSGLLLMVALVIASGLFIERYGVNLMRYHNPVPDCSKVLDIEDCNEYGPWARDHYLQLHKSAGATRSPSAFAADWFYGMWLRMFFAVDGPHTNFQTRGPLVIPGFSAIIFAGAGTVLSLAYAKRLFRKYSASVLTLMLSVAGVYIAALWLDGYRTFLRVGQPVAINGRYLFPVLPFLLLISALAVNELCKHRDSLKLFIGAAAVLSMLWGGGALTYVLRSDTAWYWPGAPLSGVNNAIRRDAGPLVPGYNHPMEFMSRN